MSVFKVVIEMGLLWTSMQHTIILMSKVNLKVGRKKMLCLVLTKSQIQKFLFSQKRPINYLKEKKVTTKKKTLLLSKCQNLNSKWEKRTQRSRDQGRGWRQKQEQGGLATGKSARRNVVECHHAWQRSNLANRWGRESIGGSTTWRGDRVRAAHADCIEDRLGVVAPPRGNRETSGGWISNHESR